MNRQLITNLSEYEREINLSFDVAGIGPVEFIASQDRTLEETGGIVWDAAVVLAEYFCQNPALIRDKSVLELGCGTGFLGSVLSAIGANMLLTDTFQYKDLVIKNLANNSELLKKPANAQFQVFDWSEEPSKLKGHPFDVVVMTDVIYNPEALDLLYKLLPQLVSSSKGIIYMAQRIRFKVIEDNFLTKLNDHFEVEQLDSVYTKSNAEEDISTEVRIFRLEKKQL